MRARARSAQRLATVIGLIGVVSLTAAPHSALPASQRDAEPAVAGLVAGTTEAVDETVDRTTDAVDETVDHGGGPSADTSGKTVERVLNHAAEAVDRTTDAVDEAVDRTTDGVDEVLDRTTEHVDPREAEPGEEDPPATGDTGDPTDATPSATSPAQPPTDAPPPGEPAESASPVDDSGISEGPQATLDRGGGGSLFDGGGSLERAPFPLLVVALLAAFLGVQAWMDRRDPKLTVAPVETEPDLVFERP